MRIRSPRDFSAGIGFVGFGVGAVAIALRDYEMGDAVRMGPGYFPVVLGAVLVLLGLLVVARSLVLDGPGLGRWHWRPLLAVASGCIVFAYSVRPLGIVWATAAVVLISALGRPWIGWTRVIALCVLLGGFAVLVFIEGLGLPLPVWPRSFG